MSGFKYISTQQTKNTNLCNLHGMYSITAQASNNPNGVEGTMQTFNVGNVTSAQLLFQYYNSIYKGRVYFRVGNSKGLIDKTQEGNYQDFHELHSVGYPYSANFIFALTATYNIGSPNATANNIYAQNAVTVVSDENHKTDISELNETEIACAKACAKLYRRYKLKAAIEQKSEVDARYHLGAIAQQIVQCFTDHSLDWHQYGIITYEKWDAIEAVEYKAATFDEEGKEITAEINAVEGREAGEIYMMRYEEFNCFVNAGMEAMISDLEARLAKLESA